MPRRKLYGMSKGFPRLFQRLKNRIAIFAFLPRFSSKQCLENILRGPSRAGEGTATFGFRVLVARLSASRRLFFATCWGAIGVAHTKNPRTLTTPIPLCKVRPRAELRGLPLIAFRFLQAVFEDVEQPEATRPGGDSPDNQG